MLLGVSRQSVTKWESEKSYPEMDKLLKMCQIFGCTLDDLVQGDLTETITEAVVFNQENHQPTDLFGYDEHMTTFAWRISLGVVSPPSWSRVRHAALCSRRPRVHRSSPATRKSISRIWYYLCVCTVQSIACPRMHNLS